MAGRANAALDREDAAAGGESDGLGAAGGAELAEERADVEFGGVLTDAELASDGFVGQTLRHEQEDLLFSRGQRLRILAGADVGVYAGRSSDGRVEHNETGR